MFYTHTPYPHFFHHMTKVLQTLLCRSSKAEISGSNPYGARFLDGALPNSLLRQVGGTEAGEGAKKEIGEESISQSHSSP